MKKIVNILMILAVCSVTLIAQERAPESKPDKELTCEEAELRIQDFNAKVQNLQGVAGGLKGENDGLAVRIETAKQELKNCNDAIMNLIGASEMDIQQFRQRLGVLEGKVRSMSRLSDDQLADQQNEVRALESELNEMRGNKIAIMPEFYNKIIQLGRDIKGLYREKKIKTYTVGTWAEDRDCLWNIAGKIEIYGDPFLWPKIWQTNTNIIRNPDIIHPGDQLTLPEKGPKSDEEMKAERRYWRNKRAAEEAAPEKTETGTTGQQAR